MNEGHIKAILDGDTQAARFIVDNFRDVQVIVNKGDLQVQ